MKRQQLEHILRAAGAITGSSDFVVIGSQAILGQFPNAPTELLISVEADLFSIRNKEDAELVEGSIGEGSPFHQTFGYFAHGVGEETAVLPAGWKDRLIPINNAATGGVTGLCLEVHDLSVSKITAGRAKDMEFVGTLIRHGLAHDTVIRERLSMTKLSKEMQRLCEGRLERLALA